MSLIRGLLFPYSNSMRIIFYFILSVLILFCFLSCSKGEPVKDLLFGKLAILDFTPGGITIVEGGANKLPPPVNNVSLVSGGNRFRFYAQNNLLLDTSLMVEAYKKHTYFMFKPNVNTPFRVFDESLNGFDKETLPDASSVKISFANFSGTLPDLVNIYVRTNTYKIPVSQQIQIGEFLNVSTSFSGFKKLTLGLNSSSLPENAIILVVKDPVSQQVLKTINFTLPKVINSDQLVDYVYLLYVNDQNGVTTLMSK